VTGVFWKFSSIMVVIQVHKRARNPHGSHEFVILAWRHAIGVDMTIVERVRGGRRDRGKCGPVR
jgi:hypothetical protein